MMEECPWCGKETAVLDLEFTRDGEEIDTECQSCGKPIRVLAEYSIDYFVEKIEVEEVE